MIVGQIAVHEASDGKILRENLNFKNVGQNISYFFFSVGCEHGTKT